MLCYTYDVGRWQILPSKTKLTGGEQANCCCREHPNSSIHVMVTSLEPRLTSPLIQLVFTFQDDQFKHCCCFLQVHVCYHSQFYKLALQSMFGFKLALPKYSLYNQKDIFIFLHCLHNQHLQYTETMYKVQDT